jgi:cytochrome c oxidase accessory protein FixG
MNDSNEQIYQSEEFRDSIATVDKRGKRIWIYPKKPKGRYTNARTYVSWILLVVLFGLPFVKINGEPMFLFNIIERRFHLFGVVFMPQDFYLFGLAMLTFLVFIILFTVVYGRLFCGWVCPQTIFMEMVFRKIEYWIEGDSPAQRRLNKSEWNFDKYRKKILKHIVFGLIAILVANTFLSYIIGVDEVIRIATEPVSQHRMGFISMIAFSGVFYYVFAFLREQVCVTICPYGRLQGVMLDKKSIVVAYDWIRGEPRGKIKKKTSKSNQTEGGQHSADMLTQMASSATSVETPTLGDCIDCHMCVYVCPTGIDIRNGTQLECINCTACMDACDEIMDKVDRPRGLIRYDSVAGIQEGRKNLMTPRAYAYSLVLLVLLGINGFLLGSRGEVEAVLLRTPGKLYQEMEDGYISNLYNYQLINKTTDSFEVELVLISPEGRVRYVGASPTVRPGQIAQGAIFIDIPVDQLDGRKTSVRLEVKSGDKVLDRVKTNFSGPNSGK